jgi:hypothetical protein
VVSRPKPGNWKAFLSPTGAGIVLICFFLPWVRVSCAGKEIIISGANLGGIFWLVFVAGILTLLSSIYFKRRGKIKNAKPIMLICAVIALGTIAYKYISAVRNPDIPFYVPASAINVDIKIGAIGTIAGLLMITADAIIFRAKKQETISSERESDVRSG